MLNYLVNTLGMCLILLALAMHHQHVASLQVVVPVKKNFVQHLMGFFGPGKSKVEM